MAFYFIKLLYFNIKLLYYNIKSYRFYLDIRILSTLFAECLK